MAFFLAYLFSFWRYSRFCYANEKSDDVRGVSTKTAQRSKSRITLVILKQCSSNLAPAINETE